MLLDCTYNTGITHTQTHTQPFYDSLDYVWENPGDPVSEETYHGDQSSIICFLHLLWSTPSNLFNLCAWQSFSTISVQVFFGLPLGLSLSTLYCIHFFTQSLSSFRSTCPYRTIMTRRASHPQYIMGILRTRIVDKGPGVQVGWVMTLWGAPVDVGRLRNP